MKATLISYYPFVQFLNFVAVREVCGLCFFVRTRSVRSARVVLKSLSGLAPLRRHHLEHKRSSVWGQVAIPSVLTSQCCEDSCYSVCKFKFFCLTFIQCRLREAIARLVCTAVSPQPFHEGPAQGAAGGRIHICFSSC